jgi:hypothetical protein
MNAAKKLLLAMGVQKPMPSRTGLILWLDALLGVYAGSGYSGATPTEGGTCGSIVDQSGNANNFSQVIGGREPLYTFNAGAGYPGLVFSSAASTSLNSAMLFPDAFTFLCVYQGRSGTNGSFFGNTDAGHSPLQRNAQIYPSVSGGGSIVPSSSATLNTSQMFVQRYTYATHALNIRLDKVDRGSSATNTDTKPTGTTDIGQAFSEYLNGKISTVIMYSRVLTDDEVIALENWAWNRYI